ncbi:MULTISPECIES: L-rhamnose/proton symporter RhaT [Acidobacteriaceae]|uniref:L-rhamnose/proton symporter RhaT n=1 Tax=Acidobacteriaceae TaxID=204434 RepID=UPI00131E44AD|nr:MULTISPECIES: L-rhamnose/proton symporter RhaT [Acidobacteriaceae]MDW5265180.1 L-rhamnose/proton symporter RhaT [Edaphobacter sp.]
MSGPVLQGIGLTMIAGVMSGNCMLPMKFARRWRWENVWLVFSLVSLLVLPWALALMQVDSLFEIYRTIPLSTMYAPLLFGAGWGVAQILFGISVVRLGMGVGYAVIVGLGAVLGTLVPLFMGQRRFITNAALVEILVGVIVMVLGIVLTAWGGQLREHDNRSANGELSRQQGYVGAVMLAVLCGLLAPMLNYAFAFGQGLAEAAVRAGNTPVAAAYAVWPIALLGGLVPNILYSLYLLRKNRSWGVFTRHSPDVLWAALMAILWMGAFALYGVSSVYLGALGTSIGWGLFQIFMIMTATTSGLLTAEWRRASRRAMMFLGSGMAALIGATVLLSMGGR